MMSAQPDYFPCAPILDWLPDETLFSLVSRVHLLWGSSDAGRTASLLFGGRRRGTQHDLPGYLSHFAARNDERLGNAHDVARERTVLAFYRRFMSVQDEQEVLTTMSAGNVAHLKFRLGLLTSRFRANHPLKACVDCMARDVEQHGWAYWHLRHQYPGVWWCPDHGDFLRESTLKSTGVERFHWILPREELLMPVPRAVVEQADGVASAAAQLEQVILGVLGYAPDARFEDARLCERYRLRLLARDWMSTGGQVRWSRFVSDYLEFVRPLRLLPELSALPATEDEAIAQLGRTLRSPRSAIHPLRHLIVVSWLFGDAESFHAAYCSDVARLQTVVIGEGAYDPIVSSDDPRRERLIELLRAGATSVRSAAKAVGIDISTAMTWAAAAGLSVSRRPKMLMPVMRMRLVELLQNGEEKLAAASAIGVSVQVVTRTLFTEIGLHEQWSTARALRIQGEHRQRWQRLLNDYAKSGVKVMRGMEPRTYAWLYRNDREWLCQHTPDRQPKENRGLSPLVWRERDARLHQTLQLAVLQLARDKDCKRIYLWMLYQAVPELRPMLSRLDHLPLTKRCIEQTLAWRGPAVFSSSLPFA